MAAPHEACKLRHQVMRGHPNLSAMTPTDVTGFSLNLFGQPSN